jgi:hypothetical protein
MVAPILMYGSETWVHSQKEMNKIQTAEMLFLRKVKLCTRLDRIRNENIRTELNIYSSLSQYFYPGGTLEIIFRSQGTCIKMIMSTAHGTLA